MIPSTVACSGIQVPDGKPPNLSFNNLVEAHVLSAIRRKHEIPFPKVRRAVEFVQERLGVDRPLLDQQFETDGVEIFVRELGQLVSASQSGQLAFREVLQQHLSRIERRPFSTARESSSSILGCHSVGPCSPRPASVQRLSWIDS